MAFVSEDLPFDASFLDAGFGGCEEGGSAAAIGLTAGAFKAGERGSDIGAGEFEAGARASQPACGCAQQDALHSCVWSGIASGLVVCGKIRPQYM